MEILKKSLFSLLILLAAGKLAAQSNTVLQKAFQNSYAEESKKNYSTAISIMSPYYSENNYELNLRMGWLNYLNKNYTASQNYYLKAINLRKDAIEARFGYIQPLSLLKSTDKVLEQYNAILRIDPQNTQANYWAGVIYYGRKDYVSAARYFGKVVSLYPFDYDGNHMLGWTLLMSGRKQEAKASFERALLIKPEDSSSTDGLNRSK